MGRWSRPVTWADAQERVTASRHDPSIGTHGVYQGTGDRADVIDYAIAQHDDDRAIPWEASYPRHVPDERAGMPHGPCVRVCRA